MTYTATPDYVRIVQDVTEQIRRGQLVPGAALPSTSELMSSYGVSNTVIRAAVNTLKGEGLVVGRQGKGVFVREDVDPAALTPRTDVESLAAQLAELVGEVRELASRVAALESAPQAEGRDAERHES